MKNELNFKKTHERINGLIREVLQKEHKVDTLPNSSFDFSDERQAMYFSNMRKNMSSETAHMVINCGQQLADLKLTGVVNGNGKLR